MPTEKTPLTSTPPNFDSASAMPYYVQDTYRFYSRRRRERQLQCIMFVTIVATFIMALIVTVSYSVNHPDVIPPETNASQTAEAGALLKLSGAAEPRTAEGLSAEEMQLALEAGNAAIAARRLADSKAKPLPEPSPESRHQFAVGTGPRAERIAMAGLAEIAATRKLESSRSFLGKPSRFGSFLDGGWTADELCTKSLNSLRCSRKYAPGKYREIDGSCNHPQELGMAYTAYRRAMPADYADGIDAPRLGKFGTALPSAREVSLKVHPPSPSTNPSFTVMLAVFGQFLDHDITATAISQGTNGSSLSCCPPSAGHPECFPVKVGPGDPVYDIAGSSCMEFVRSAPAAQCRIGPRQQLNQVTAFIDGSTIYGSDFETANDLREFSGGRLLMQKTPDNRELLPASRNLRDGCNQKVELARGRYCFASGDRRANENLHLTTMHVLWARQHNRLVDRLSQLNPEWEDETLYQEARRIVGAQLQHISYREFVPVVLGESEVDRRNLKPLNSGFRSINATDLDPSIANHFAAAAFRFAHTLLPGLMKVTDMQKGTSSYVQLHKMLFNPYSLYAEGGLESSITSATTNPIQKTSTHVTSQLTEHLFEDPIGNQTSVPCGLDLVSLNIQRGRDHGLPGYTKWREHCGLGNPLNFQDLKDDMDPEALDAISKLYDNVDDIDLYTGALAELPKGMGLIGPTFTCLIADQFERLQLGDRYWYEFANQPGSFNEDQLKEIRKTTLARIICDTSDGINQIQQEVMRSVSTDNPVVSCEDIPQLSLDAWKSEMPLVTLSEINVPIQDWIHFKYEVNKTLTDMISNIISNKPPPGSLPENWLDFQNGINKTFTDLKNKFSAFHPKVVSNVKFARNLTIAQKQEAFDWTSLNIDMDSTILDIIDSINANKPPPGSLPADWLEYKKKINDSITDIRKKFKILHPKSNNLKSNFENINQSSDLPLIDWAQIKDDINSTIADIVGSINASKPLPSSPPADWLAFKSKIANSLVDVKNKFKGLRPKPMVNVNSAGILNSEEGVFDWTSIKSDVDSTILDIIDSINANKPPPGSLPADWLEYKKKINDSITDIRKKFKILHPKSNNLKSNFENINQSSDLPLIDWAQIKDDINSTVADIINSINASKPLAGSPPADWLAFKSKIANSLVDVKNRFASFFPKAQYSIVKLSVTNDESAFGWLDFKTKLNESLSNIIASIGSKKPPAGSTSDDWLQFQKEVNKTLTDFIIKFSDSARNFSIKNDKLMSDNLTKDIGNNVNKSVSEIIAEINASKPEPGSPQEDWDKFRQKMTDVFANVKNKYVFSQNKNNTIVKLSNSAIDTNFDEESFRDNLNKSLSDLRSVIKNHTSAINNSIPEWLVYKNEVKVSLNKIKDLFSELKKKESMEPEYMLHAGESDVTFDWIGWKIEMNKTIDNLIDDVKNISSSDDPKWISFRDYLNKYFTNLKNKASSLPTKVFKSKLMAVIEEDWLTFIDKVNETIEETLDDINSNKPTVGDPAWLNYNIYIKNRFAEMHEDLKAIKTEWLENLKVATNLMIVTDVPITNNSASLLRLSHFKYSISFLFVFYVTDLIRLSL